MRRGLKIFALALAAALSLSSCDFFRRLAGRPDSARLAYMRAELERREEARRKAVADSLERETRQLLDSLAAADSLQKAGETMQTAEAFGGLTVARLPGKYYIIAGAFADLDNARRYAGRLAAKGHSAEIIAFRNGYNAVGICRSDVLGAVSDSLKRLRKERGFPKGAWVLNASAGQR